MLCLLLILLAVDGLPIDVAEVVRRHEAGLAKVRSIITTIDVRKSEDRGRTWEYISRYDVRRRGDRERVHAKNSGLMINGIWHRETFHYDDAFDLGERRHLGNLDPDVPPILPLTTLENPNISGSISAPTASTRPIRCFHWAWALLYAPHGQNSLGELVEASKVRSLAPGLDPLGDPAWVIELEEDPTRFVRQ